MVSTVAGVSVFLTLLTLGAHVLLHLYASSVLTVTAFDAAREASGGAGGQGRAEARARSRLGDVGRQPQLFDWTGTDADDVVLTVRADTPDVLPSPIADAMGMDVFTRTLRLRREAFR